MYVSDKMKTVLTISIDAEVYQQCKAQHCSFSKICEEALRKWLAEQQQNQQNQQTQQTQQ